MPESWSSSKLHKPNGANTSRCGLIPRRAPTRYGGPFGPCDVFVPRPGRGVRSGPTGGRPLPALAPCGSMTVQRPAHGSACSIVARAWSRRVGRQQRSNAALWSPVAPQGLRYRARLRQPYQLPMLGIVVQGSAGASAGPAWSSSMLMPSGERTKAMRPSRGGRLMVTPCAIRRWQAA